MAIEDREEILSGDRLSRPDEQTEIDDEISDQLKEDAGSRHDVAIIFVISSTRHAVFSIGM